MVVPWSARYRPLRMPQEARPGPKRKRKRKRKKKEDRDKGNSRGGTETENKAEKRGKETKEGSK